MKELRCDKCNTKKDVKYYRAVLGYEYDDEIYYDIAFCDKCADKHNANRNKHGYQGNLYIKEKDNE